MNSYAIAAIIVCAATLVPAQNAAETQHYTGVNATLHRVNVAERQAMLAQRIAKAACFVAREVTIDDHYEQLAQARASFETAHDGLIYGSAALELQPENEAAILGAQIDVSYAWKIMLTPINQLIDGRTGPETIQRLQVSSSEVLGRATSAASKIAHRYDTITSGDDLMLNITTDVAGRQRVLLQMMVKDACLMGLAGDPAVLAGSLAETVQIYDRSLTALRNGLPEAGVLAAPNSLIGSALAVVEADWAALRPLLDEAGAGSAPDNAKLLEIETKAETILHNLEAIVLLYEAL